MEDQLFIYKDRLYSRHYECKMKVPNSFWTAAMNLLSESSQLTLSTQFTDVKTGKKGWIDAVVYADVETQQLYCREKKDFYSKFELWKNPNQPELEMEDLDGKKR
jgi:hypothetical protein